MTRCEFCYVEEERIYKCKKCGTRFCMYCGSPEDKLCLRCLEEKETEEDENEEDFDEYEIYFEESPKLKQPLNRIDNYLFLFRQAIDR